jgi:putative chitobiose transport system substrate-binding protein
MPYDAIQNKLITAAAGGNCPDVVNLNTQMALILAGKNILTNLDEAATEEQRSVYVKTLYDSTKTSKGAFAFPWYGAPSVLIYNKDLFVKAGIQTPPTSFDEMLTIAESFKQKTGSYLYIPDEFRNILFLEGIPLITEDKTKAAFNTPEALELLNKYKAAAEKDILPKTGWGSWDKMLQQFNTGKLGMMNTGTQSIKRVKDEAPNIYKAVEVAPAMVGKAGVILNPIMNIVVPKLSKNVTEAVNLAAFITNDDNQLGFAKTVQIFPSTTKASQDPFFKSDTSTPETKAVSIAADELLKTADVSLAITKEGDIFTAVNKVLEAVIVGKTDPKKALDDAEKKVNELLAQEPQ